jgi:hypothetical protein
MQILFISDEGEILKFLSGAQAVALMPQGNVEISGLSEDTAITVICSGGSTHYHATITRIVSGYLTDSHDEKWLALRFIVRRINSMVDYDFERTALND